MSSLSPPRKGLSTGRRCDGYSSGGLSQVETETLNDSREQRSFQFFIEKTAPQLSGYFDRSFWNVFVLHVAESSVAIKHALVAIGAVHETLEISYSTWLHQQLEPMQLFALHQYNKSIGHITKKDSDRPSIQVLLVSCILFVTIQVLQRKRSMELVQRGLHMLRLWQNSDGHHATFSHLEDSGGKIESEIVGLISRLGINASTFVTFISKQMYGDPNHRPTELKFSDQFSDLHEARSYFDNLMANLFASVECPGGCREDPISSAQIVSQYTSALDSWWSSFQACLGTMGPMKDDAQCAALILHSHYHIARIEVHTLPYNDEMLFDNHLENFKAVIHFTQECLKIIRLSSDKSSSKSEDSIPKTTMSFGLEPGTVSALLWTTLHCRDPRIRRESIGILQTAHRREGALDSMTAAKVTAKMVEIEENGPKSSTPVQCPQDIPASSRIIFLSSNFHGVDPEKGRPMALDQEVLEAHRRVVVVVPSSSSSSSTIKGGGEGTDDHGNDKDKPITTSITSSAPYPVGRVKKLIPYPDNWMICRYVKRPWNADSAVHEVWLDLNADIHLPGYTQLPARHDWHPASKCQQDEIEKLTEFYRDREDPDDDDGKGEEQEKKVSSPTQEEIIQETEKNPERSEEGLYGRTKVEEKGGNGDDDHDGDDDDDDDQQKDEESVIAGTGNDDQDDEREEGGKQSID